MHNGLIVRKEQAEDQRAVWNVTRLAFNRDEEADLIDRLRSNEQVFIPDLSLVAAIGSDIVGHILFTKMKIIDDDQNEHITLALAPVSVVPAFQNQGIGSRLIRHGLDVATKLGYTSVIVLGHEHYYPRFGFYPARKWGILAPFDVPETVFMAMELAEDSLVGISGTVRYPEEFGGV